jgi:glycosyltransferase involved in cell wall biosynthesis
VFPSIDEGFGIPLIEAMRAHIPVICSDIKIFKEIGDDSVVYFKKQDYNDLYNKLKLICKDKTIVDDLILKGIKRADLFNQKNFIEGFEKLY